MPKRSVRETAVDEGADRRTWLGFASKEDQLDAEKALREEKKLASYVEEVHHKYHELDALGTNALRLQSFVPNDNGDDDGMVRSGNESVDGKDGEHQWKQFWATAKK